jgi:hypothetical protein
MPLPRSVGGYTVIRTTQIITGSETVSLFGPVGNVSTTTNPRKWTNACRWAGVAGGTAINAANNWQEDVFSTMTSASFSTANLVPAAFSVQIMNPEALQTSTGIVYVGKSKQLLSPGGSTQTWDALAADLVAYSNPELISAASMAFTGCQVDCTPYDMNAMSDFRPCSYGTSGASTLSSDSARFDAMAPIFVYNPNGVALQYLVCCEWRCRFDPTNPAYAGHVHRPAASLGVWEDIVRFSEGWGNGVKKIGQHLVANHGTKLADMGMSYLFGKV